MARVVGAIGILLFAASLAGQNLLKNGSFDKDLSSWTLLGGTQATWVPDDALSRASGSVRTVDTVIIQSVPVTPGVRYYLRGFVTRNAGSVSLGSLVAGWCADLACTTAAVSVGQYFFVGAGRGTGEWQLISGEAIAPPNAVAASINVGHDGQAFDEVYFSTTPPPPLSCNLTCPTGVAASAATGSPVSFTSNPTGCAAFKPFNFMWTFGDGTSQAGSASAVHTYSSTGTMTWSYVVTGTEATVCSATGSIVIGPPPQPRRRGVSH